MKRMVLLGGLVTLGLLWSVVAEQHPAPRLTGGVPRVAAERGHDDFLAARLGAVTPGYAEGYLQLLPPDAEGVMLVDRRHSSTQPWDQRMSLWTHSYSQSHGYARAFAQVQRSGIEVREQWADLTPGALSGAAGLFINLPSGANAAFDSAEVVAIEAFVRHGGGLVLITDHTNAYLHGDMLEELQQALGFELPPVTNADVGRGHTLGPTTVAWVRVRPLLEHPLTRGVDVVGMTTGGVVEGWTGLMGGSERSWQDLWNPDVDNGGYVGDLKRQSSEKSGPSATVAVREHGLGRAVIVADQNVFGSSHIGYEDNEQLWSNAVGWALRRDMAALQPPAVSTLTGPRSLCSSAAGYAFLTLQVQSARLADHTGRPDRCSADQSAASSAVLLLPEYEGPVPAPSRGVALIDPEQEGSRRLLESLGLAAGTRGEPVEGPLRWVEAIQAPFGLGMEGPLLSSPVTLQGEVHLVAEDALGRPVVVRSGPWLLVLDASLLANEAMGKYADPREQAPGAYDLAFRLLGWLFTDPSHEGAEEGG